MKKCVHHADITHFCLKQGCHYPLAGGCSNCFIQDHPHPKQSEQISLEEIQKLIKKYLFPKRVKPQCNHLQQGFFNYFRVLKSQLNQIIDSMQELCKNVVNSIGFPYLSNHGTFQVYKRLKNHDLNKITPNQLYQFVAATKTISSLQLTQQQESLYISQVSKYYEMIKQINSSISVMMNTLNHHTNAVKYTHNSQPIKKIKQLIKKIEAETGKQIIKVPHHVVDKRPHHLELKDKDKGIIGEEYKIGKKNQDNIYSAKIEKIGTTKKDKKQQYKETHHLHIQSQKRQRKQSFKQSDNILFLQKVQSTNSNNNTNKQTNNNNNSTTKRLRRQRRNSIDYQLPKTSALERKAQELKRNKQSIKQQQSQRTQSSKQIKNYDLPHADSKKKIEHQEEIEVRPVTRKLDQDIVPQDDNLEQSYSPLLRKRRQHNQLRESKRAKQRQKQSADNSADSSSLQNPLMVVTPLHSTLHGVKNHKHQGQSILMHEKKQSNSSKQKNLPQLSQKQQISYVLLIKSLSLQTQDAIIVLQKCLQTSQNNLSAAQYLSFLYLQSNQPKKCLDLCQKYLKKIRNREQLQDSILLLICNKSGALNSLGRYSETITLLNSFDGQNQVILKNLANAYLQLNKYEDAIPLYKKAMQDCNDDQVAYNLSVCWYMKQDYTAAKFSLQSALMMQPKKAQYKQLQKQIIKRITQRSNSQFTKTNLKKY